MGQIRRCHYSQMGRPGPHAVSVWSCVHGVLSRCRTFVRMGRSRLSLRAVLLREYLLPSTSLHFDICRTQRPCPTVQYLQCIFTLATKNLGVHTKRGSGLIVMGVGGGAWYPPAQAALAETASTRRSYLVPFTGYTAMSIYAMYVTF